MFHVHSKQERTTNFWSHTTRNFPSRIIRTIAFIQQRRNRDTILNNEFDQTYCARNNLIRGTLFDDLYQLPALKKLLLSGNYISGTLSEKVSNLVNLEDLWLANNYMYSSIPKSVGELSELREWSFFLLEGEQLCFFHAL